MSDLGNEYMDLQYRYRMRQIELEQELLERDSSPSPTWNVVQDYGMLPFNEVIPPFWREEILEPPDSPLKQPMMYAVMQGFGSLACYLYSRILKICKESKDDVTQVKDLRLIYSVTLLTMKNLSKRREATAEEGEDEDLITDDRRYLELQFL